MSEGYQRWYDKDPVLSMSMRTLSNSTDETQIAVTLNLIKVIIEHNIADSKYENVEDILGAVEDGRIQRADRRWYDIDSTVRTAIQMLEKCTPETRKKISLDMAQLVIETIIKDVDEEEIEKDDKNIEVKEDGVVEGEISTLGVNENGDNLLDLDLEMELDS